MSQVLKTIKIKSTDPKTQGEFVEINETDFNEKEHVLYTPKEDKPKKGK